MFQIDLKSRKAIYEQVVDNFKRLITTGVLQENEKAPSIRDLAGLLDVNPNTVQKAYRELENKGYFYTVLGQGSFISPPPQRHSLRGAGPDDLAIQERLAALLDTVRELVYRGMKLAEVIQYIEREVKPSDKD